MPSHYPKELRERATRLAVEARSNRKTKHIANQLGVNSNTLRAWVQQAEKMRPADLANHTFSAGRPNQHGVADITYVKAQAGWVYAAFVIDVFSCMTVSWQTSKHRYTELASDALNMAVFHRQHAGDDLPGLVHH